MVERPTIDRILASVQNLPTLPKVLQELSQRMDNPITSSDELAQVISQDQSLASKVLRLVNSAFYGYSTRIGSIRQGILILGFNTVKNLVLSTGVLDIFQKALADRDDVDPEAVWLHVASTAGVARLIAERRQIADAEEAFVVGLLHEIGRLLILLAEPAFFLKALELARRSGMPAGNVMEKALGFHDAQVASALADQWRFPMSLQVALRWHHHPARAGEHKGLATCAHLGGLIAEAWGHPSFEDLPLEPPDPSVWELAGFRDDEILRQVLREIPSRLLQAEALLGAAKG